MLTGILCLAEGIDLFAGKDFLMFLGSARKNDYDLKKVYSAEKWVFLVDAVCSAGIGLNRFSNRVEYILLAVFAVTLAVHVYIFKSKRFKKK